MYIYIYTHIHIYIYTERERKIDTCMYREREREREREYVVVYVYIYIYIYIIVTCRLNGVSRLADRLQNRTRPSIIAPCEVHNPSYVCMDYARMLVCNVTIHACTT